MWYARRKPNSLMLPIAAMALLLVIGGAVVGPAAVRAQTGGPYNLTWWTVDGGGDRLTGGSYVLVGTAGQPDAAATSGGTYVLAGGFWPGGAAQYRLYLPLTLKSY
ncbi:MAG: hypothetical protein KKB13_01135 [Chloroflexi bacterium]|nr:hypothetical protein [Chloroflexota bacterium]